MTFGVRLALLALVLATGCAKADSATEPSARPSASAPKSSIAPPVPLPQPRQGMLWIPPGALVVGTPSDSYPRLADEEIPGEQVIIPGYYIDAYAYPNEEGAIPLTNVSREEAAKFCAEREKRLCSELEWERACKGPDNRLYEYGDRYRPEPCATGTQPLLRPSGLRVACRSDFGVRDLHGGAWEWTRSPFGRGSTRELSAVRGGNAPAGELVGRCANAIGRAPDSRSPSIGFRCCIGAEVVPEVELVIRHARKLEARERLDPLLTPLLLEVLPDDAKSDLARHGSLEPDKLWTWWPLGNDELVLMSVCAGSGRRASCGVLIARVLLGKPAALAWAEGGTWQPMLRAENDPRDIWLLGGDDPGAFRRRISYVWGRVGVGPRERRIAEPKTERGPKGQKGAKSVPPPNPKSK